MKISAIVPIRHHSERLPGKNYLDLDGHPLFYYILKTLDRSNLITRIIVDTNSEIVKKACKNGEISKKIVILDRSESLSGDHVSTNSLIERILGLPEFVTLNENEIFIQTHVTNPFLKLETIENALKKFIIEIEVRRFDSILSVSRLQTRLYDIDGVAINHEVHHLSRTQDLNPVYEDNSCFYIFTRESFCKHLNRIGETPYYYPIESKEESLDIDWRDDFILAELYMKRKKLSEKNGRKVVLITGVNGGIGSSTARRFKKEGWIVVGTDLGSEVEIGLSNIVDLYISADLVEYVDNINFGISRIKNKLSEFLLSSGSITGTKLEFLALVNVAAVQICKNYDQTTLDDWDRVMNCNLKSVFELSRQMVSLMNKGATIVNVSSIHSIQTSSKILAYGVSKAAVSGLTRSLAVELAPIGIRVNSVCPGAIDTPMLRAGLRREYGDGVDEEEMLKKMGHKHLMGKVGRPEDIASAVYFLANGEESSFILGTNLVVDGGTTIALGTE